MAVLQPGFPLPRAKYLYFIFSSENISAKGFFRRGRSLGASRKKFGKGERYEEESHDASHPVSPCFAYAFQSKSAERSDASKFPHVKGTNLRWRKKVWTDPCITMPDGMRAQLANRVVNTRAKLVGFRAAVFRADEPKLSPPLISPSVVPLCPISAGIIRIDGKAGGKFRSQVDQVAGFASNFVYVCFAYVANKGESKGNVEKKRELQGERERES